MHRTRRALVYGALAASLLLTACTGGSSTSDRPASASAAGAAGSGAAAADLVVSVPTAQVSVLGDDEPESLALAASKLLLRHAETAVVAPAADPAAQQRARSAATRLHAPLLLVGADAGPVASELDRLGVREVVAVGTPAGPFARPGRRAPTADNARANHAPPKVFAEALSAGTPQSSAAEVTARAAGLRVAVSDHADVRTDAKAAAALGPRSDHVVVLGSTFGSAGSAAYTVAAAQRGLTLPGGGQVVFPGRRFVALYGVPNTPSLGVLGEQPLAATLRRAQRVARPYAAIAKEPVVATLELIATVASGSKGSDGNYSNELDPASLRAWVVAAHKAGMYVVLDLQPGRASFLKQAKLFRGLLERPDVGLGLDPEWRLGAAQRPLSQIGSVDVDEVNEVLGWLARLTRQQALPQKVVVVHQFQQQMIRGRSRLDTSHTELAVVLHADGQGTQGAKAGTWAALRRDAPPHVAWGWKNFYDEDRPTLSAAQTYAVRPRPDFVSYQ